MDKLTRHPLLKDIPMETVIDYTIDFIRIVGTPPSFFEKTEVIEIEDYKGKLPCDFYEMKQVRTMDGQYFTSPLTYKIQGDCIFTSVESGEIEIAYLGMPINEEGYPLLPDNSTYIRALENYIKLQWFTILFDTGKLQPQILQNTQQQYAWAVGQAQAELILPTIDQMEMISNMWCKLLPDTTNDHQHGYMHEGTKERFLIH